ncbi:MAG TPA: hypothetical protein VME69_03955 [Methylocella sp.]|nr:hypothetical protein [Methylocella sp.]
MNRFLTILTFVQLFVPMSAWAQDTSFMDMNMSMGCMLMAGMHEAQVSVFQEGATEDTCPDLPFPGSAIVTLTASSKELRDLTQEVRLVRGAGVKEKENLDPITLAYLPPKIYPTGVITLPANFDGPGKYTLLVTVSDGKDMSMTGDILITVGEASRRWTLVFVLMGLIVAAAFGYYFWDKKRKNARPA